MHFPHLLFFHLYITLSICSLHLYLLPLISSQSTLALIPLSVYLYSSPEPFLTRMFPSPVSSPSVFPQLHFPSCLSSLTSIFSSLYLLSPVFPTFLLTCPSPTTSLITAYYLKLWNPTNFSLPLLPHHHMHTLFPATLTNICEHSEHRHARKDQIQSYNVKGIM